MQEVPDLCWRSDRIVPRNVIFVSRNPHAVHIYISTTTSTVLLASHVKRVKHAACGPHAPLHKLDCGPHKVFTASTFYLRQKGIPYTPVLLALTVSKYSVFNFGNFCRMHIFLLQAECFYLFKSFVKLRHHLVFMNTAKISAYTLHVFTFKQHNCSAINLIELNVFS